MCVICELSRDAESIVIDDEQLRWNLDAIIGTPVVVTYSFPTEQQDYDSNSRPGFTGFSDAHKVYIKQAFDTWAAVSGISFVEVPNDVGGAIRLAMHDFTGLTNSVGNQLSGFAYYPSIEYTNYDFETMEWDISNSSNDLGGDIFMNSLFYASSANSMTPGIRGYSILLHEIGHAIGLKHPFEGDPVIDPAKDNGNYSVMSYNRSNSNTELGTLDIEATQYIYGTDSIDAYWDDIGGYLVQNASVNSQIINGWDKNDHINANSGDDKINGRAGDDIINGDAGNDILIGGAGNDTIDGGADNDTVDYSAELYAVNVILDGQAIGFGIGVDSITNVENIIGSNEADTLTGNSAANVIKGGLGADTIDGGDGDFDTVNYGQSLEGVTVNLDGAAGSGGEAEGDTLTGIEQVIGSLFGDIIIGNGSNNVFFAFDGDDQLFGGEGSDFLLGGLGADHLDGGNGILDTADYRASQAGVTVDLIAGTGLGGDAEGDTLVNIDQLLGSGLGDNLTGNDENNILFGFSGDDTLSAGIGNDFLVSGLGADTLNGGLGSDTANYLSSTLGVAVDLANNVAIGGEADGDTLISIENIIGTTASDTLLGSAENNLLFGFGGNDVFNFTSGVDTINGGADSDRVVFSGNQADFNFINRSDIGAGVVFAADGSGLNVTALFDIELVTFNDTGTFDLSTIV